ncbi:MAG: hypothetical protein IPG04_26555 [Polyangiaceae bacterium]|nr:hypothetical protein [Polyangiaceae bacterium]
MPSAREPFPCALPVVLLSLAACDAPHAGPELTTSAAVARSSERAGAGEASSSSSSAPASTPTVAASTSAATPVPAAPRDRPLACGLDSACLVGDGGAVTCWGRDGFGQLGTGVARKSVFPPGKPVKGLPEARSLAVGLDFACSLSKRGEVHCWGSSYAGQSGNGVALPSDPEQASTAGVLAPAHVKLSAPAVALDAGVSHACAVLDGGTVECWGANEEGQLGVRGAWASAVPLAVPGVTGAVEVATGGQHSCARRADGSVVCWGKSSAEPAPGYCASQITAGSDFTCAIGCAGGAHCWGGMPGLTAGVDPSPVGPTPILGAIPDVAEIRAGHWHLCARDTAGVSYCWGMNDGGQLGVGKGAEWSDDTRREPEKVLQSWRRTSALCAGGMLVRGDGSYRRPASYLDAGQSCALADSGEVYCWGGPKQHYEPVRVTKR